MDNTEIPNNDMNTGNQPAENNESHVETENSPKGMETLLGKKQEVELPESYDFTSSIPEGAELDEETAKAFGDILKPLGLTNEQANTIAKFGFEWADKLAESYQQEQENQNKANIEAVKKELGHQFDSYVQKAGVAVEHLEKEFPNIRELFSSSPVFSSVEFLKAMAEFGSMLSEDHGMGGKSSPAEGNNNPYPNTNWSKY